MLRRAAHLALQRMPLHRLDTQLGLAGRDRIASPKSSPTGLSSATDKAYPGWREHNETGRPAVSRRPWGRGSGSWPGPYESRFMSGRVPRLEESRCMYGEPNRSCDLRSVVEQAAEPSDVIGVRLPALAARQAADGEYESPTATLSLHDRVRAS